MLNNTKQTTADEKQDEETKKGREPTVSKKITEVYSIRGLGYGSVATRAETVSSSDVCTYWS